MKAQLSHDHVIDWPNGLGFTPCTKQYADTVAARDALHLPGEGVLDELSPEDYQKWNELDNEALTMQVNGHVGKSVRY